MVTAHFMVRDGGTTTGVRVFHTTKPAAAERLERFLNETADAGKSYALAHIDEPSDEPTRVLSVGA